MHNNILIQSPRFSHCLDCIVISVVCNACNNLGHTSHLPQLCRSDQCSELISCYTLAVLTLVSDCESHNKKTLAVCQSQEQRMDMELGSSILDPVPGQFGSSLLMMNAHV